MPQLMPLMWVFSIFMSFLMIMMLVEMYFYKEENINMFFEKMYLNEKVFEW